MPSFLTASLLLGVLAGGATLAVSLLLLAVAGRIGRDISQRRRARSERQVRPLVLAAAAGECVPSGLLTLRGGHGRAAERVVFGYLARVRGEAHDRLAQVLEQRGTVDRFIRHSGRPGRHRRAVAAERLGLIASPAARRRLCDMVATDSSLEVRVVATRALGKTGSAAAATALLRSLSRAAPVPPGIVASALLELGPDAVPALCEVLDGQDAGGRRQRSMAAEVLGLLDEMTAWRLLADNSEGGDLKVRISAVRALGRLGLPQAAGAVAVCLRPGEDPALRAVAARALGRIGDPGTAPALAACLDEPGYWIAHNAAEALAALGPAGRRALARAAAAQRPGARHAREALARAALMRAEPSPPARPAGTAHPPATQPAPAFRAGREERG